MFTYDKEKLLRGEEQPLAHSEFTFSCLATIQLLGVMLTSKSHYIVVSSCASNLKANIKMDAVTDPSAISMSAQANAKDGTFNYTKTTSVSFGITRNL
jgi:hypothetical protein